MHFELPIKLNVISHSIVLSALECLLRPGTPDSRIRQPPRFTSRRQRSAVPTSNFAESGRRSFGQAGFRTDPADREVQSGRLLWIGHADRAPLDPGFDAEFQSTAVERFDPGE